MVLTLRLAPIVHVCPVPLWQRLCNGLLPLIKKEPLITGGPTARAPASTLGTASWQSPTRRCTSRGWNPYLRGRQRV